MLASLLGYAYAEKYKNKHGGTICREADQKQNSVQVKTLIKRVCCLDTGRF